MKKLLREIPGELLDESVKDFLGKSFQQFQEESRRISERILEGVPGKKNSPSITGENYPPISEEFSQRIPDEISERFQKEISEEICKKNIQEESTNIF